MNNHRPKRPVFAGISDAASLGLIKPKGTVVGTVEMEEQIQTLIQLIETHREHIQHAENEIEILKKIILGK